MLEFITRNAFWPLRLLKYDQRLKIESLPNCLKLFLTLLAIILLYYTFRVFCCYNQTMQMFKAIQRLSRQKNKYFQQYLIHLFPIRIIL